MSLIINFEHDISYDKEMVVMDMDIGVDIPTLATGMAQSKVMDAVGTKVMDMALDTMESEGAGVINMIERSAMENSVYPNLGGNFDMSV